MAKTKVSQFDATASNNTDINSVNVAEGCPPSGINNAIREMASLLKKQEVGTDPMTSPDIDGGTIDGATIGASSASTGAFTNLSASGTFTSRGIDDNADATAITIDSSENVGIGTTDVRGKLQIGSGNGGGNTPSGHELLFGANNSDITFLSANDSASVDGTIGAWNTTYNHQNSKIVFNKPAGNTGELQFFTNAGSGITERMRITSAGKVGIGTSSPQKLLDITDSSSGESIPLVIANKDTTAGTGQKVTLAFGLSRNSGAFKPEAGTIEVGRELDWTSTDTTIDSYMAFSTYLNNSATEKMRIDSSGNVGIGTTSPASKLHIKVSNNEYTGGIQIEDTDSTTKSAITHVDNNLFISSNATNDHIVIDATGAVTMPLQPAFLASNVGLSTQANISADADNDINFGTEVFDQNADFASNVFTAPVTGRYQLSSVLYTENLDTSANYYIMTIVTSNRSIYNIIDPGVLASDPVYWTFTSSVLADMDAGDTAKVSLTQVAGTSQTDINTHSFFSGYLVA